MATRLLKKAGVFLLFFWAAGSLIFLLVQAVPGDPLLSILGPCPRSADVLRLERSLQLDRPLADRYLHFISRLIVLDLGHSLIDREPVLGTVLKRLPNTIALAAAAMSLALLLSLPIGFLAAFKKKSGWGTLAMAFSSAGLAVPPFLLGILLVIAFSLELKIFPVSGSGGIEHIVLPALTLGISFAAFLTRLVRTLLQEESQRPYVLLARAKGLCSARIYRRHVLRNALAPIVTLVGLQAGAMLSGAIVVESVFSWPGIGTLLITAVRQRDYPVIRGTVLLTVLLYLLVNFMVDLSYPLIDPRVSHDPSR
jgi:peptide/nickel transport system permease protein